jgi:hypothetical protein
MVQSWDLEHLIGYCRSWSATQRYVKAHGEDPLKLIAGELNAAWGDREQRRDVTWPLDVRVGRIT